MKSTIAALLLGGSLLAAGAAGAQTPQLVEVPDATIVQPFNIAAGLLDDIYVYTAEGVEIGDVEEIVGSDANTPTHLAVDFSDRAGYADRDVLVPVEAFRLDANRLIISLTPQEVAALPTWDD